MLLTELPRTGSKQIFAAGFRCADDPVVSEWWRSAPVHAPLADLARQSDAVLVYDAAAAEQIGESLADLREELPAAQQVFIALVPLAATPAIDSAYGEPIASFVCSADVFLRFLGLGIDCYPETLCFALLRAIANGDIAVDRLLVRQIPLAPRDAASLVSGAPATALVLPHRGSAAFLRASLNQIARAAGRPVQVRVGLDVDDESPYASFPEEFPHAEFFHFSPAPVGPYLIRQQLAERSPEP
jgi:hypothetical protein